VIAVGEFELFGDWVSWYSFRQSLSTAAVVHNFPPVASLAINIQEKLPKFESETACVIDYSFTVLLLSGTHFHLWTKNIRLNWVKCMVLFISAVFFVSGRW